MTPVLRVLGPIEMGASPLAAKLLALLSLHAGRTVTVDEAMDVVWDGHPPRTAAKSLQNLVVGLRRLLGADAIVTTPSGYRLAVPTDAERFQELVRGGRPAEALALWRDAPWPELADHPHAVAEAVRLEELRRGAEEAVIEGRLRRGHANAFLVAEAERLVAASPLREHRWALLMRALHAAGRSAEALRAAQRLRSVLAEEVGVSPGDEITALETSIARNDPELGQPGTRRRGGGPSELEGAARRAGEAALETGEFREAVRWLRLAGRDADLLLRLGTAEVSAGEPLAGQLTLLAAAAAADAAGDLALVVDALVAAGTVTDVGTDAGRRVREEMRRVLRRRLDDRSRARLLAALVSQGAYVTDDEEPRRWYEEAVAICDQVGDASLTAEILASFGAVGAHPSGAGHRLDVARELEALADALSSEALLVRALILRRWALLELGDPRHREVAGRLRDLAVTSRDAVSATGALMWSGGAPLLEGDAVAAEEEVQRWGLAATTILPGSDLAPAVYLSYLFTVRWMQGRLRELRPLLEAAAEAMPSIATWRSALALALTAEGEHGAAQRTAAAYFATGGLRIPTNALWSATIWHLTETVLVVEDRSTARHLLDQIAPVADRHALYVTVYLGSFHHHLARLHALLGERTRADAHRRAAGTAHADVGASWWAQRH